MGTEHSSDPVEAARAVLQKAERTAADKKLEEEAAKAAALAAKIISASKEQAALEAEKAVHDAEEELAAAIRSAETEAALPPAPEALFYNFCKQKRLNEDQIQRLKRRYVGLH